MVQDATAGPSHKPLDTSAESLAHLKDLYHQQGYLILDGIFAHQDLTALRTAAEAVTQLTRSGQWPHRRIVGRQFPPYEEVRSDDSWGVQHLLHPDLPHHNLFASFYGSSPLLDVAAALLGVESSEQMQLELFNLLIEPQRHCFALGWHRDDIRADVEPEEERRRLEAPLRGIQWNACLYDDDCLFVVPGTQARVRNEEERHANAVTPPAARLCREGQDEGFDGAWEIDPPGTLRVQLKAGQTVLYSQRILHRASYLPTRKRATLHGCYGEVRGAFDKAGHGFDHLDEVQRISLGERARNTLQHGVDWMTEPSFGHTLPPRLQPMWKNLIRLNEQYKPGELGFSLEG